MAFRQGGRRACSLVVALAESGLAGGRIGAPKAIKIESGPCSSRTIHLAWSGQSRGFAARPASSSSGALEACHLGETKAWRCPPCCVTATLHDLFSRFPLHLTAASPVAAGAAQGKQGGVRWSAVLLGIPSAVAAYLCSWQVQRRQKKIELLAEREARMSGAPLDLFEEEYLPEEYTRVTLSGTFDYSKDAFVGPRGRPSASGMTETVGAGLERVAGGK